MINDWKDSQLQSHNTVQILKNSEFYVTVSLIAFFLSRVVVPVTQSC